MNILKFRVGPGSDLFFNPFAGQALGQQQLHAKFGLKVLVANIGGFKAWNHNSLNL